MPTGVGGWDTVASGRCEISREWYVGSTIDVRKGEGKTVIGVLLQRDLTILLPCIN